MKRTILSLLLVVAYGLVSYAQSLVPMHNSKGQFGYGEKGNKKFTIKPQWDEARPFNEYGIAIVRKGVKWGFIDRRGKAVGKSMGYSLITDHEGTDYWLVALGGKFTDKPIKHNAAFPPLAQGFRGSKNYNIKGAKWGLMAKDGRYIVEPKYNAISSGRDGMIVVRKGQFYGYVNNLGKEVVPVKQWLLSPFNNLGYAYTMPKAGKMEIVDKTGRVIISAKEKVGLFTTFKNSEIGTPEFLNADSLLSNKALWNDSIHIMPVVAMYFAGVANKYYGFTWNNTSIPYIHATKGKGKKARVVVYDLQGNQLIPDDANVTKVFAPSENVCFAQKDGKWGFYDLNTHQFTVLDQNRTYYPFHEGLSLSFNDKEDNNYYFVDRQGNKVSDTWDDMGRFNGEGYYSMEKNGKWGLIDSKGCELLPFVYEMTYKPIDGYMEVDQEKGKQGICDVKGNVIVPAKYNYVRNIGKGFFLVEDSTATYDKWGILNSKNEAVIPVKCDTLTAHIDNAGKLHVFKKDKGASCYTKVKISTSGNLSYEPTPYTWIGGLKNQSVEVGQFFTDKSDRFGYMIGDEEVFPAVTSNVVEADLLMDYLKENGFRKLNATETRVIAKRAHSLLFKFTRKDIKSTLDNDLWDF